MSNHNQTLIESGMLPILTLNLDDTDSIKDCKDPQLEAALTSPAARDEQLNLLRERKYNTTARWAALLTRCNSSADQNTESVNNIYAGVRKSFGFGRVSSLLLAE